MSSLQVEIINDSRVVAARTVQEMFVAPDYLPYSGSRCCCSYSQDNELSPGCVVSLGHFELE